MGRTHLDTALAKHKKELEKRKKHKKRILERYFF